MQTGSLKPFFIIALWHRHGQCPFVSVVTWPGDLARMMIYVLCFVARTIAHGCFLLGGMACGHVRLELLLAVSRNDAVARAFKLCAKIRGSKWNIQVEGKHPAEALKSSKKTPLKKLTTWSDFCSFAQSIRILRQSRGIFGAFLPKRGCD